MRLLRERAIERLRADAASLTEGGSKVCTLMIAFFLEGKWGDGVYCFPNWRMNKLTIYALIIT